MRICLHTYTALPHLGGQELVVDTLARHFTAAGHQVLVLAPWHRRVGWLDPASVPYEVAWHSRFRSTRWFLDGHAQWLTRLHRRWNFHVIHSHTIYPVGYVAARATALAGVPRVLTSHGDDVEERTGLCYRKPDLRERYRFTLAQCDAAVAISRFTEDAYRKLCPELPRVERIPNGVDAARLAAAAARPEDIDRRVQPRRYFLFLGRLDQRKGVDLLLRAFARLATESDLKLVVAGGGAERAALEALATHLGIAARVCFSGPAGGTLKTYLLQNALATVMPSRWWEAFPLVLLESFAAGRPVIGTQIPGLGDLIQPGRTGLLVPPECTERLAALLEAAGDPARMDVLGAAGRRVAQDHDWALVARRHLDLFAELAEQRRSAAWRRAAA